MQDVELGCCRLLCWKNKELGEGGGSFIGWWDDSYRARSFVSHASKLLGVKQFAFKFWYRYRCREKQFVFGGLELRFRVNVPTVPATIHSPRLCTSPQHLSTVSGQECVVIDASQLCPDQLPLHISSFARNPIEAIKGQGVFQLYSGYDAPSRRRDRCHDAMTPLETGSLGNTMRAYSLYAREGDSCRDSRAHMEIRLLL